MHESCISGLFMAVFDQSRAAVLIDTLAETGRLRLACIAAGVSLKTASSWRTSHKTFAQAWDDALKLRVDILEDECLRRAVEGVERPVYQQGRLVGTVRDYSDQLLALALRAADPARYGSRVDITSGGEPVQLDEGARAARIVQLLEVAHKRALMLPGDAATRRDVVDVQAVDVVTDDASSIV